MYRDRGYAPDASADETTYEYVTKMRLEEPEKYLPAKASAEYPALEQIIAQDAKLKYIYDSGVFELDVDGDRYPLISQILRKSREILYLTPISTVKLRMKKHMLQEECDYPENNALYLMLLSGDLVTYGDEGEQSSGTLPRIRFIKGCWTIPGTTKKNGMYMIFPGSCANMQRNMPRTARTICCAPPRS